MASRIATRRTTIARAIAQHRATLLAGATATAMMMPILAMSQQLEEVLVTAEKRVANLQDTALSMQVLGTEQIQELGISGFDDYIQFLPSVAFTTLRPGISQVYMRGINSGGDGNHSASMPSVGVYLDEQPITTINEVLDLHMYDIAQIEALAGPQGTLFGSSSQAGTLRIITNKPSKEFEASYDLSGISVEEGDTGYTGEGMVNFPIGDSAALRLVGWYDDAPGYIDNVPATLTFEGAGVTINNDRLVENDFNDTQTTGGRALLRVDLNENWAITPGITYQKMDSNGAFDHDPDDYGDLETTKFYDTFYDEEWYQASLTVEGRVGDIDIVYAGAYLNRNRDSNYDYSWFAEYYDNYYSTVYLGYDCYLYDNAGNCVDPSQYVDQDERWTRDSQEIRLQSQEGRLRWITGFFYQNQEHDFDLQWISPELGTDFSLIPDGHTAWQTHQTREDKEHAVFGEISYDITDAITVLGGARYYNYKNSLFGFNGWYGRCTGFYDDDGNFVEDQENGSLQFPCYNTGVLDDSTSNDDIIGKANISYDIDDNKLVYFTWSEGYRPGGVNRANEGFSYAEDSVTNWEVGWKTTWMDNRLRFNGAFYYMEWEDFQYNSLTFGEGVPLTIINNAGQAEVYGSEFDLDYALAEEFTLSFSGSYNDAETTDVIELSAGDIPEGTAMPYTPEWQLSSILRYDTQFGEYGAYAQGAVSYSDGFSTDLRPQFAQETDSYSLVNLAIGIARDNWHVDLFLDNATDERAELGNVVPENPSGYYSKSGTYYVTNQPRSISLRFGQKF